MFNRIIRMAAVACTLSFLVGCTLQLDPAEEGVISFTAGSPLLRDDATKAGVPKDAFGNGDSFFVWGAETISQSHLPIFTGQSVSYNGTVWSYSPIRFWDSNASQYDFLALSGPSSASSVTCTPSSLPLQASITYRPTSSQYDLMAACAERTDGSTSPVNMNFHHMLSAVSVVVYNDSPIQSITINSYKFKNLCIQAMLTVEQDVNTPQLGWVNPSYDSNMVLGNDGSAVLVGGETQHYPTTTVTDFMIPQVLDPLGSSAPALVLNYTYQAAGDPEPTDIVTQIRLQDIKILGSDEAITSWQSGVKYNYEIHIRLGGGIRVHVITTEWEVVDAETPGLMI